MNFVSVLGLIYIFAGYYSDRIKRSLFPNYNEKLISKHGITDKESLLAVEVLMLKFVGIGLIVGGYSIDVFGKFIGVAAMVAICVPMVYYYKKRIKELSK